MQPPISATVTHVNGMNNDANFLSKASVLIVQATEERARGAWADALEYAYRAGLRVAGARLALADGVRRRRPPVGALNKLRLVGPHEAQWADRLAQFSRVRSRLAAGMEHTVDPEVVDSLIEVVTAFLQSVESGEQQPLAA